MILTTLEPENLRLNIDIPDSAFQKILKEGESITVGRLGYTKEGIGIFLCIRMEPKSKRHRFFCGIIRPEEIGDKDLKQRWKNKNNLPKYLDWKTGLLEHKSLPN